MICLFLWIPRVLLIYGHLYTALCYICKFTFPPASFWAIVSQLQIHPSILCFVILALGLCEPHLFSFADGFFLGSANKTVTEKNWKVIGGRGALLSVCFLVLFLLPFAASATQQLFFRTAAVKSSSHSWLELEIFLTENGYQHHALNKHQHHLARTSFAEFWTPAPKGPSSDLKDISPVDHQSLPSGLSFGSTVFPPNFFPCSLFSQSLT